MQERVDKYIGWYNLKAIGTKAKYLRMRAMSVVGGALVPVLVNVNVPYVGIATTLISIGVVVLLSRKRLSLSRAVEELSCDRAISR
jgi:hypothetical protein